MIDWSPLEVTLHTSIYINTYNVFFKVTKIKGDLTICCQTAQVKSDDTPLTIAARALQMAWAVTRKCVPREVLEVWPC